MKFFILTFLLITCLMPVITAHAAGAPAGQASGQQPSSVTESDTPSYLQDLHKWLLLFVGLAAVLGFTLGGFFYIFSGGSEKGIGIGKQYMKDALIGLLIAALGFTLLYIINPEFINHGFDLNTVVNDVQKNLLPQDTAPIQQEGPQ